MAQLRPKLKTAVAWEERPTGRAPTSLVGAGRPGAARRRDVRALCPRCPTSFHAAQDDGLDPGEHSSHPR
jgi:hypothetical protein